MLRKNFIYNIILMGILSLVLPIFHYANPQANQKTMDAIIGVYLTEEKNAKG